MPAENPPDSMQPSEDRAEFVGPYRLGRPLGSGGMGEVYEGYDERLDRSVALKRVRPGAGDTQQAKRRFQREARSVARLQHPAIVQIHDWVEGESGEWIVMELVHGRALKSILADGPLEPQRALALIRGILQGLAAAHAAGVVHRDLKAENVMVAPGSSPGRGESGEQAKILDFGLAKRYDPESGESEASLEGGLIGTPPAMSPEMLLGRPVDHRSDLFSLGSLCYEMLTGVSPFLGDSPGETLHRICTFQPESATHRNPRVPQPLADFVERLLQKDPRRRPQDAERALVELEAVAAWMKGDSTSRQTEVQGEDLVTLLPEELPPAKKAGNPRRWAPWAAVILSVLALLAWRALTPPSKPVYVAVPATKIVKAGLGGDGESSSHDTELAASAVRTAVLRTLLGFRQVVALEPSPGEVGIEDPLRLARAMAADEVFTSQLECVEQSCQLVLKRLRGSDGQPLWARGFAVFPKQAFGLSLAVLEHVRAAYPKAQLREGVPDLAVDGDDYKEYLEMRWRFRRRQEGPVTEALLQDLRRLEQSSSRFVALPLFEALVQIRRHQQERAPAALEAAEAAVERARAIAPKDPRVLTWQAHVARVDGRFEEAGQIIETLQRLEPGNARPMVLRAQLLEAQGNAEEALDVMRESIDYLPAASSYFALADILYRQGAVDEARSQLELGLRRWPESYDGQSRLAQLELMSGSPERAVVLYETLVERSAETVELSNLGSAYLLVGRHEDAARSYREAFELAPRSPHAALNLADAELLLARTEESMALYQSILEMTEANPEALLTIRAQAFVRLGRHQEAVAAVQDALRRHPDHPGVSYEAALVYSLLGDQASAVLNARRALTKGYEPRWFTFPWFDSIRDQLEPLGEERSGEDSSPE